MLATRRIVGIVAIGTLCFTGSHAAEPAKALEQEANTWVKRSPLKGGPVSPGLGYECSLVYDETAGRVIRWGGHNQGGGGEQNSEVWSFDPLSARWEIKEPNTSPPGVCCAQQNVFDPLRQRFLRFPAFSGSHGWHWFRENYLSNSTLWDYDLASNTWRDRRPLPAPRVSPLRCAAWDSDNQVAVVFGGEGNQEGTVVYDPFVNLWTRMNPKTQPGFRSGGNMAYDATHHRFILFGSQFGDDPHTWAYDLRKNEWHDLKPASQPPTDRNDAVLAYDADGQVVIALVRVADKREKDEIIEGHLETWAFDAGKNTWTRMKPAREPDGKGNRRRNMVALPNLNLLLLEAYVNPTEHVPGVDREQQIWTYRYAAPRTSMLPSAPTELRVQTDKNSASLSWKASVSADVQHHAILRGEGNQPWLADWKELGRVDGKKTTFADTGLKAGTIYHYAVRALAGDGKASPNSLVRTQPALVEDAVVSVIGPKEVQLEWSPPLGKDIAGYHIERAPVDVFTEDALVRLKKDTAPLPDPSVGALQSVGAFTRLTDKPVSEPKFTDSTVDLAAPKAVERATVFTHRFSKEQVDPKGKPYRFAVFAYRIRAVNQLGVEGGDSPIFLTIPSAPQQLFAKEDGEKCLLKWAASKEKGIRGYRVYRMESPRVNGPGQPVTRLTADPIAGTTFTDSKAGKDTHRYWIVAVDALGQEGIPSAPAWYYRQYRKYYEPFVGEWHQ
jgi:hypothetical protein